MLDIRGETAIGGSCIPLLPTNARKSAIRRLPCLRIVAAAVAIVVPSSVLKADEVDGMMYSPLKTAKLTVITSSRLVASH